MNRIIIFTLLFFTSATILNSQQQILPLNVARAFEEKTRSDDGLPGQNYWQNTTNYTINAVIDTKNDRLNGSATLVYFNNSPDTLSQMVFRLYQDFFRKGNARQWPANLNDLNDGIQITSLEIDGKNYDPNNDFPSWYMTNLKLKLKKKILPGSSSTIKISWNFEIPTARGLRMRKYDEGHYFMAYWYPQIAVYDDIDGWDNIEYLGMVEFYNDFNLFDVHIKMPGDYVVWATGDLQNPKEVFFPDVVKRYEKAKKSDEVVHIIGPKNYSASEVTLGAKSHQWHFIAKGVPDFSFAASTHANWDGSGLVVDSITGVRSLMDAVYPEGSHHWEKGAMFTRESVKYLSFDLPGIPYPYSHMTSFWNESRGGGMETPMMANNGNPRDEGSFARLLFHEITHSYFPFYMGTNERKYSWMDEGWAAYLPNEFSNNFFPDDNYLAGQCQAYLALAGMETELPLMVPSFQHSSYSSARVASYTRPAMAYHMLRNAVGDELFKKALQEFMFRWNGKHPIPYDFFNTFENVCQRDLDWFWNPWFFETGYPDLAIDNVGNDRKVTIRRVGNFPIPIKLIVYMEGRQEPIIINQPISIWASGKDVIEIELPMDKMIERIELGDDIIPDVNLSNNVWVDQKN